ncbi:unnamed protein product [Adineta ricciae]|uniref:RRM domain-containing protein n=1 Tax=Adineta ricciae TaxID=249248 RepID=A0A813SSK0_ADIRI|nr:unnamed protein product [Adineta ricciae]CAF1555509.1 unnamed protein product [Adineta ricciae]
MELTDKLLIRGVDQDITADEFREELIKQYHGIKRVERLYNPKSKKPTETIRVELVTAEHSEAFLQTGYINFDQLRCSVEPIKSRRFTRRQTASNTESDHQSDISSNEQQRSKKLLVHGVPTDILMNDLGEQLSKVYPGIKHVKRWLLNDEAQTVTERVQIDFNLPAQADAVLQNGYIHFQKHHWPVTSYVTRSRPRSEPDFVDDTQSEHQSEPELQPEVLTEQEIHQIFDEQKKQLAQLIAHFDAQLNSTIASQAVNQPRSARA